jgi:hypothetical protein
MPHFEQSASAVALSKLQCSELQLSPGRHGPNLVPGFEIKNVASIVTPLVVQGRRLKLLIRGRISNVIF